MIVSLYNPLDFSPLQWRHRPTCGRGNASWCPAPLSVRSAYRTCGRYTSRGETSVSSTGTGISDLAIKFPLNRTNPGLFSEQISVHFASASQNVLNFDLKKSHIICPICDPSDLL